MAEHDLIDEYLDRLRGDLSGSPEERDDAIAELRDHLLEATERLQEQGLDPRDAQFVALGRLGDAGEVARLYGAPRRTGRLGRRTMTAVLAAVAIVAVGAGALVASVPFGNDPELARRLGFEPTGPQEPLGTEVRGIPLPKGVSANDPSFLPITKRMAILDGWRVVTPRVVRTRLPDGWRVFRPTAEIKRLPDGWLVVSRP